MRRRPRPPLLAGTLAAAAHTLSCQTAPSQPESRPTSIHPHRQRSNGAGPRPRCADCACPALLLVPAPHPQFPRHSSPFCSASALRPPRCAALVTPTVHGRRWMGCVWMALAGKSTTQPRRCASPGWRTASAAVLSSRHRLYISWVPSPHRCACCPPDLAQHAARPDCRSPAGLLLFRLEMDRGWLRPQPQRQPQQVSTCGVRVFASARVFASFCNHLLLLSSILGAGVCWRRAAKQECVPSVFVSQLPCACRGWWVTPAPALRRLPCACRPREMSWRS